jgi:hypothetical protein
VDKMGSFIPEGHILDSKVVEDKEDMFGPDLMKRHIVPTYPEAKLMSWDEIK